MNSPKSALGAAAIALAAILCCAAPTVAGAIAAGAAVAALRSPHVITAAVCAIVALGAFAFALTRRRRAIR